VAKRLTFLLATLLVFAGTAHAQQPLQGKHLTVALVSRETALVPGRDALLGLDFKLEPGWHVYWSNAGDSGDPPDVKWTLPSGITAGKMQFPAPRRLPLGPLMDFGYENAVLFPVSLQVAENAKGTADISADIRWLVCREVCIPGKGTLTLSLPIAASTSPNAAVAADFQSSLDTLPKPFPSDDKATVHADKANFYITLKTGHQEKSAEFYPLDQTQIANAAPQVVTPLPDGIQLTLKKDENLATDPAQLRGVVELSGGRDYTIAAEVMPGAPVLAKAPQSAGSAELLRIAAFAFLGGIILNLMPCVFPVLFIKGLGLLQSRDLQRADARKHGAVYTLGILVSFWAIVAVLVVLRAGGQAFGWGFQFQSPTFVAVITLLLFFFGLSLAGMFEFGLSLTSAGGSLAQKQGYSGSFFTGMLATVVATPCTAPFMGAAIGFALSQSVFVTFVIFTALALGLALPYVLLTFFPAWMKILPRPGAWMEVLKQAASVPIFGTVIWLLWLYAKLASVDLLVWLMAGLLLVAVGGWMLHRWVRSRAGTFVAVLTIVLALLVPVYGQHLAASQKDPWQPWTSTAVATAQQQGKPVFVDFTAAWCLSCQVNEKAVLQSRAVQDAMDQAHVVRLRADWTHYDGDITAALSQLGRSGVPTYVVYGASAGSKPDVLPEALTQSVVVNALHQIH
jgi:thiol:disulfide interchange protein DsbD